MTHAGHQGGSTAQSPDPSVVGIAESTAGALLGDGLRESALHAEYWLYWAEERPPKGMSVHEPVNVTLFGNSIFACGSEDKVILNLGGP